MRRIHFLLLALTSLFLQGCGSDCNLAEANCSNAGNSAQVASIALITSDNQLPSDGSQTATITATVQDSDNVVVSGQNVSFSVDSGGITITQGISDDSGVATAVLSTANEPQNRTIEVTASAGGVQSMIDVVVAGTELRIDGPDNLAMDDVANYSIFLTDAGGNGIADTDVVISAGSTLNALGNTVTVETDDTGQAQISLTADNMGTQDTIVASALGVLESQTITISQDSFMFTAPLSNQEIELGTSETVTVQWIIDGTPVNGGTINFLATRGLFAGSGTSIETATTNASGIAQVALSANNAGPSTITAQAVNGPSTSRVVELVALTPASIEVQADPFSIGENEQATIEAVVKDANDNLVKNATVNFTLDDTTSGSLTSGFAVTNSIGEASTVFQASSVTSATDAVVITATVVENQSISDIVELTVAQREVFINFGFDDTLVDVPPDNEKLISIRVLDANNVAIPGVDVQLSVRSKQYTKGFWDLVDTGTEEAWINRFTAICDNEDLNLNGSLDVGEDINNNGKLDPGGVVGISPGTITTDNTGSVIATLNYSKLYGSWLSITVEARAGVEGTEFIDSKTFLLGSIADDLDPEDAPTGLPLFIIPGFNTTYIDGGGRTARLLEGSENVSPFGYADDCTTWLLD